MTKVLIVDDSLFMRNHVARLLQDSGYETLQAANGLEALDNFCAQKPDIVIMDITMPHMNGLEALTRIRECNPEARVIIVTALSQKTVVSQALRLGAKDFLVKPFSPERLLAAIEKILK